MVEEYDEWSDEPPLTEAHNHIYKLNRKITALEQRVTELEKENERVREALSADDARWISEFCREATNTHGMSQKFDGKIYYISDAMEGLANLLETPESEE